MIDPGLRSWLRSVEASSGLAERTGDATLVMLPPPVAAEFDLPTELVVTPDPDVAREDGTVLLSTGHPVLIGAADAVLTAGDTGVVALAEPTIPAPVGEQLQDRARDQFPIAHARVDLAGLPTRIIRPVLRVGALVTYTVSAEECFQERLEPKVASGRWVAAGDQPRPTARVIGRRPTSARRNGQLPTVADNA